MVVGFSLIGIGQGELGKRLFRFARTAQVGRQNRGVARAGVAFGQQFGADARLGDQTFAFQIFRFY